jgi:hypothetical protein
MSSPIHHAEDLDEALHYAPPWAREQGLREPLRPAAALVRSPPSRWRIGVTDDAFSGDRAMVKLQRQLALDPDAVPEPPVDDIQSLWPMALRLCAVAGVAAAVAWLVISLPGTRLLRHDVVHADIQVPPVADTPKQDPLRMPAAAGLLLQHGLAEANAAPSPAETMPVAVPPPLSAPSAPPSSDAAVTQIVSLPLDSDEIAMLLKRGKDAFSTGDLAAARLLLRRAAEGGSAEAALALGATFDPLIIRRLGAIGAAPDAAQARQWYQKAVALGSTTASQPLAQLEASAQ